MLNSTLTIKKDRCPIMRKLLRVVLAAAGILASASASASLIGSSISQCSNTVFSGSVTTDLNACDSGTAQAAPVSAVVGNAVEFTVGSNRLFDFGADTLTISYSPPIGSSSPDLLIFHSIALPITSVSLITGNPLAVTWDFLSDRLAVLVSAPKEGGVVTLQINTRNEQVPVPGVLGLMSIGLAGLLAARRRRV